MDKGNRADDIGVLVLFEHPERLRDTMTERFPGIRFGYASRPDQIAPMLESMRPEFVLGIKTPAFPGASHREAFAYPTVRWFSVGGSGYDHLLPWPRTDLTVTNAAGVLARFLAETVTAAMLLINCNFHRYAKLQRNHSWQALPFAPLAGKTLLLVGVGAIGGCVADNAKALGMRVLGTRRTGEGHRSIDEMHRAEAFTSLLPQADFVSLHVRLTDATRAMVDADALALMKPDATLINTARGGVVDEGALINALAGNRLKAAYLDVFETEPLPPESPLWSLDNAVVTPHAADSVVDWPERFAGHFMDNMDRWFAGEPLVNRIEP